MARKKNTWSFLNFNLIFVGILLAICILGCVDDKAVATPRKEAFPRMESQYDTTYKCIYPHFNVHINENVNLDAENLNADNSGFSLRYEKYSATLYCSLFRNLSQDSLNTILHRRFSRIALDLGETEYDTYRFENRKNNCYATIVYSERNCATPVHFIATDSCRNVVSGVVVMDKIFKYDSIAPVIGYLNDDVSHLIRNLKF